MPKISVIVPVYNVEDYLNNCLDSLVNQSFADYEIIVIDDGSTDKSSEILKHYEKKYSKLVKVFRKKNGGQASARNLGIKNATGEYMTFVDSDDYIGLKMLEHLYKIAIKDKADIVICDIMKEYPTRKSEFSNLTNFCGDNKINYMLSHPGPVARLYKSNLLKDNEIKFFENVKIYEDLATIPLIGLYAKKIKYLEKPYYYYTIRLSSSMNQELFNSKLDDIFAVMKYLSEEFEKRSSSDYSEELEYLYIEHLLRSAILRFAMFDEGKARIDRIVEIMENEYPNWKNNKYYKKRSLGFKVICFFAFRKHIFMLKLINHIRR